MAKFRVTAPDGRKLEFDGPDGATEDDAIKYAQANMPPMRPVRVTPGEPSAYADENLNNTPIKKDAGQLADPAARMRVSPETEAFLVKTGVYPEPGSLNPLKHLNRAVMNPVMGLIGGIGESVGNIASNVTELGGQAGDVVDPRLGRDIRAGIDLGMRSGRGALGASGVINGIGVSAPSLPGWLNPAKTAANGVRETAMNRVASALDGTDMAARTASSAAIANDAKAIQAQRLAAGLGADASRASSAQIIAEQPRAPVSSPFGAPPSSMKLGEELKSSALNLNTSLRDARSAAYEAGSARVADAVSAREAAGQFLKNDPGARAMLIRSREALNDTPLPGSPATMRLSSPDRMAHEAIVSALEGRPVEIPKSAVGQAIADGHQVKTISIDPPRYQVVFSNTVEGLNNVKRMFGETFKSDVPGWGAINSALKKDLYGGLNDVLKGYVGDAYTTRQAAYRDASPPINAYDTKIGKALLGEQRGTEQASTTANDLADLLRRAEPSDLAEITKLAGKDVLPAIVARSFHDPVTGMSIPLDAARKVTAPGTKLADALSMHPQLNAAVSKHVSALAAEEAAKTQQALFAQQQGAVAARGLDAQKAALGTASDAQSAATAAQKTAATRASELVSMRQDVENLKNIPTKQVVSEARRILESMSPAKGGTMSMAEYVEAQRQMDKAQSTASIQKRLLQIIGAGLVVSGTPAAGRFIYNSITGAR